MNHYTPARTLKSLPPEHPKILPGMLHPFPPQRFLFENRIVLPLVRNILRKSPSALVWPELGHGEPGSGEPGLVNWVLVNRVLVNLDLVNRVLVNRVLMNRVLVNRDLANRDW